MTALSRTEQYTKTSLRDKERRIRTCSRHSFASNRRFAPVLTALEERTLLTATLISLSVAASSLVYGAQEILSADVTTNPPGSITPSGGTVSFYDGATSIGTVALKVGSATLATTNLPVGTHVMVAAYSGSGTFASSSSGVLPTTVISTAAGVGNGGLAVRQTLDSPAGIALDSHGNVFIADNLDQEIREFIPGTGTMLTVAGDGVAGYTGDGGPATDAELSSPDGIAVDAAGNVFFTQYGDDVVREIHAGTGVITTVAGNGKQGSSGDGGPATSAELYGPSGVAVDSLGNLFIADSVNFRIRKVTSATGAITTVAGNGTEGASGDGGPATSALLQGPDDVVVDSSGDLFIADGSSVREVTAATGVITTIAGGGSYT